MPWRETILVVDDEEDVRAVVRIMLERDGYTVLDTGDPQDAIRTARQQSVHLLLTDVVMPLMKGTELANRLQSLSASTKVLLMSGYVVAEGTGCGRPVIDKPFTADALAQKVQQVLARSSPFARPARS